MPAAYGGVATERLVPSKMKFALAADGSVISVQQREFPERDYGDLACHDCRVPVGFTSASTRSCAYFRVARLQVHSRHCTYRNLRGEIKAIARGAPDDLFSARGKAGTELRLLVAHKEFRTFYKEAKATPRKVQPPARRLQPYVASAMEVLKVRARIRGSDMQKLLKLSYDGRAIYWTD